MNRSSRRRAPGWERVSRASPLRNASLHIDMLCACSYSVPHARCAPATARAPGREALEAADRPQPGPRLYALAGYLDRPFGEVVALICKGLGIKPDWAAWAGEPRGQEEIRPRPPKSPYAHYAGDPPDD